MRLRHFVPPAALLLAFVTCARAITTRDDVSDGAAQALGNNAAFSSVGKFTRQGFDITSGVLIAPNYVLTAGHVTAGDPASAFVFNIGGANYSVFNYVTSGTDDLAVFQLTAAVPNVAPAVLYTGAAEVGNAVTLVGFGLGGNGTNGAVGVQGTKRGATNTIDTTIFEGDLTGRSLYYDFDDGTALKSQMGAFTMTSSEGLIALGDSGSGLFATISSQNYLVGINYGVADTGGGNPSNYGDVGAAVRVSTANAFIQSAMPEPGSAASLLAGLAIVLTRRRRP
jgi:V8-like Glu-specific endopeptidase